MQRIRDAFANERSMSGDILLVICCCSWALIGSRRDPPMGRSNNIATQPRPSCKITDGHIQADTHIHAQAQTHLMTQIMKRTSIARRVAGYASDQPSERMHSAKELLASLRAATALSSLAHQGSRGLVTANCKLQYRTDGRSEHRATPHPLICGSISTTSYPSLRGTLWSSNRILPSDKVHSGLRSHA